MYMNDVYFPQMAFNNNNPNDENIRSALFKDLLTSTSRAVSRALISALVPVHFILVVPEHWGEETCGAKFKHAKGQTRYQVRHLKFSNTYIISK